MQVPHQVCETEEHGHLSGDAKKAYSCGEANANCRTHVDAVNGFVQGSEPKNKSEILGRILSAPLVRHRYWSVYSALRSFNRV